MLVVQRQTAASAFLLVRMLPLQQLPVMVLVLQLVCLLRSLLGCMLLQCEVPTDEAYEAIFAAA